MSNYDNNTILTAQNNRQISFNNNVDPSFAYPYLKKGLGIGLQAGAAMALLLSILQFSEWQESFIYLRYTKYLILFVFIAFGIRSQQGQMNSTWRFKHGIKLGSIATAVSASTILIINALYFAFVDNYDFSKFNKEVVDIKSFAVVNGAVFFEVLVFGMIATFLALQLLKGKRGQSV